MQRSSITALCIAAAVSSISGTAVVHQDGAAGDDEFVQRARELLKDVPIIDGHNDVPWAYRGRVNLHIDQLDFAGDLSTGDRPMHTDLNRLRQGGVGGQFWSVYIPIGTRGGTPGDTRTVIEQIDFVHRLIDTHPDHLELALTADDVERIHKSGKIASMMGMEGGHSIENSLAVLRATYAIGARYMTLTHSQNTDWADSCTDDPVSNGLTAFGKEVVREMNRIGMLVDISHVSPKTMHDALDTTRAPVIFSHSSAKAVCASPRNAPDDVLVRLKHNNGVIMITFVSSFISEDVWTYGDRENEARRAMVIEHGEDRDAMEAAMEQWREENPRPRATLEQVADHIDHVRDVAGVDHIGIGGDYDGTSGLPIGLEDVSRYPYLMAELLRRGYSDEDIRKIAGLNVLRVMRACEQVARDLKDEPPHDSWRIELDGPIEGEEGSGGRRGRRGR